MRRKHSVTLILGIAFSMLILTFCGNWKRFLYQYGTYGRPFKLMKDVQKRILFSKSFELEQKALNGYLEEKFKFSGEDLKDSRVLKQSISLDIKPNLAFKPHNLTIYGSSKNIDENLKYCPDLRQDSQIMIDEARNLSSSLSETLHELFFQQPSNPYHDEITPFFLNDLKIQIKHNTVEKFWFRLAGSSVWLEEYGVHYMVSRLIYAPGGHRNQPLISLVLCQIFDKNWVELKNTQLVVPRISVKKEQNDEPMFKVQHYPHVVNVPFWHDYDDTEGKFYGPEDPRLLLVKNSAGYMEPLIVFNAYHRKYVPVDDDKDSANDLKPEYFRSMFLCWPWQYQVGKENTDGMQLNSFRDKIYNRALEIKLFNFPRLKKEKNWTPFVSFSETKKNGYDKYLYFVYRWSNLDILKCDISIGSGKCNFDYRLANELSIYSEVGSLRGGTELVNVNQLLEPFSNEFKQDLIPKDREIWIGFARAHLSNCGCGKSLYRPNLVILTKDSNLENSGRLQYKISHISSFLSFDMQIIPWDASNPNSLCDGANVLLPNGISGWNINSLKWDKDLDRFTADDHLSMSLSVSDSTVHLVTVKNLLDMILQIGKSVLYNRLDPDKADDKKLMNLIHNEASQGIGFNNDNIYCALRDSWDFCSKYGESIRLQNSFEVFEADSENKS